MAGIGRQLAGAMVVAGAMLGTPMAVRADDLHDRVARANALMADGKADDAAAIYTRDLAALGEGAPARLWYDAGCALLAGKDFDQAEAPLKVALSRAEDEHLRAASAFNLGVLEARRAEAGTKDGSESSLRSLRRAERYFRTAAASDPTDAGAPKNVDLVQRRIAAIEEQRRQEQQQKQDERKQQGKENKDAKPNDSRPGDHKNPEQSGKSEEPKQQGDSLSDQLNDLAGKQEKAGEDSKNMSDRSDKGESKDALAKEQAKAAQNQKDLRDQTQTAKQEAESQAKAAQDPNQREAMDKAKESLDKAGEAQKKAEEKLKEGDTKSAEQLQKDAAKSLQDAAQQAKAAQEAKQKQEQAQQAQQQEQAGQKDSAKEAQPFDATAAQILDQERKIKQQVQRIQRQRSRPAPVAKDW